MTVAEGIKMHLVHEALKYWGKPHWFYRIGGAYYHCLLHVADVLAYVRGIVGMHLGGAPEEVYCNVGAPIGADEEDGDNQVLKDAFRDLTLRGLDASVHLASGQIDESDWDRVYRWALRRPLLLPEFSPVTVIPESLAAVTAFLASPARQRGNYATIDVGGGTTDLAMFWYQTGETSQTGERKAWYYATRSSMVGTGQLASAMARDTAPAAGRTVHERMAAGARLRDMEGHPAFRILRQGLDAAYRDLFKRSFKRVPQFGEWVNVDNRTGAKSKNWDLLLLGGGAGRSVLFEHFADSQPNDQLGDHRCIELLSAPSSMGVLLPSGEVAKGSRAGNGGVNDVVTRNDYMLTVAHGLCFRTPDIPRVGQEERRELRPLPPAWEPPPHTVHA